jgi:hypothetical protein
MRGVQKHDKNIGEINRTLVLFRTLTRPPTTGVTDGGHRFFFLPAPWRGARGLAVVDAVFYLTGRRQDRRRPASPALPPLSLGKFASGVLRCSSAGNIAGVHIEHRHCVPALDSDGIRGVASNLRLCAARGLRPSVISTYVLQDRVNIWMVACEFVVHRYGWAQASWAVDTRPSNTCFQKSSPVLFHTKLDILP